MDRGDDPRSDRLDHLVRALGWATVPLGACPLAAPGAFAGSLGFGSGRLPRTVARVVGLRQLAGAAGLLARPGPASLWTCVGGDIADVAVMTWGLRHHDGRERARTAAGSAVLALVLAVDVLAAVASTRAHPHGTPRRP